MDRCRSSRSTAISLCWLRTTASSGAAQQDPVAVGEGGLRADLLRPAGARVDPVQGARRRVDDQQPLAVGGGRDAVGVERIGDLLPGPAQWARDRVSHRGALLELEPIEDCVHGVGEVRRIPGDHHVVDERGCRWRAGSWRRRRPSARRRRRPRRSAHQPRTAARASTSARAPPCLRVRCTRTLPIPVRRSPFHTAPEVREPEYTLAPRPVAMPSAFQASGSGMTDGKRDAADGLPVSAAASAAAAAKEATVLLMVNMSAITPPQSDQTRRHPGVRPISTCGLRPCALSR